MFHMCGFSDNPHSDSISENEKMIERKDNLIIADTWDEMGIDIPNNKLGSVSDVKIRNCPECKAQGKKNDFSISVQPANGVGHCFKCSIRFVIRKEQKKEPEKRAFTPPSRKNLTKLSEVGLQYFVNRRISQNAINQFKIAEGKNGYVAFPYFFNGELVNIKFKNIKEKRYMQSPGGMHVVFNFDEAMKYDEVLITEGEEEAMCWSDAGTPYATSVDGGAPNPNDTNVDKKLECIGNCIDLFEKAKLIYIGVDNDDNGKRLLQELKRRFQIEKIRVIDYAPYKDANEVVMNEGHDGLRKRKAEAKEVKMEGVYSLNDVRAELIRMWHYGLPKGTTTHFPSLDERWKWREGEVTLVTGFANDGKSTLFNVNLPMCKAVFDGWKFGLYIPENLPLEEAYEEFIQCYVGKMTDKDYPKYRMTEDEYFSAMDFVHDHFHLVHPEEKQTLDKIFEGLDFLVRKYGIKAAIIDPYNSVEHLIRPGETIDQYVTRFMGMLRGWARKRNICVILIAHQNPPEKKTGDGDFPEPDMYRVKNGGSFADRTDNLLTVHRPFGFSQPSNPLVVVTAKKLKKKKLLMADRGPAELDYVWTENRYHDHKLGGKSPLAVKRIEPAPQAEEELLYDDEIPF